MESVNFITCHDGFTLYDLVAYDRKHNEANGHANHDGSGGNRSWNCGWEGDVDVPDEVVELRHRQLRNAWCLLAMAHGVPMATMGDELGRTQGGNNNAYNQDNETSWVDWSRAAGFADLERFVRLLLALRHRHPVLAAAGLVGRRRAVPRHQRSRRPRPPRPGAGLVDRRPLRHRQRVVGAARVLAPAPGPVAARRRHVAAVPRRHRRARRRAVGQLYDVGPRSVVILERAR